MMVSGHCSIGGTTLTSKPSSNPEVVLTVTGVVPKSVNDVMAAIAGAIALLYDNCRLSEEALDDLLASIKDVCLTQLKLYTEDQILSEGELDETD